MATTSVAETGHKDLLRLDIVIYYTRGWVWIPLCLNQEESYLFCQNVDVKMVEQIS